MIASLALFLFTLFLAYANGANDNFKGVATLFGSRTASYKTALTWATVTTLAGSLVSVVVAQKLIVAFSGKGLVSAATAQDPSFLLAVAIGAGLTVMIATLVGFPISTTHSLVGALVGAGFATVNGHVDLGALGKGFVAPLLFSPVIAMAMAALLYVVLHSIRKSAGITKEFCLCVGESHEVVTVATEPFRLAGAVKSTITARLAEEHVCIERYRGAILGIGVGKMLDGLHFLSAGLVSFSRGLNDTPKIMGLILVAGVVDVQFSMLSIALAMAVGGLLHARKVANLTSRDVTHLNNGQGFTANLVTALLVASASALGMPVSTTHVSVGALFGIGAVNRRTNYTVIGKISASWILTLPLAGVIAALSYIVIITLK